MKNIPARTHIPDGWSLLPVSDVFTFVKSYAFSRDNLVNGMVDGEGVGNIHYGDIHSTFTSPSIDLSQVSIPTIKDRSFVPKKEDLLKDGDLIMADASEDYAGVGVTVSVHGLKDRKVVGGLHTFVLRDVSDKTDEHYRQYVFRNPKIRNSLKKIANGVSVYGISKTALSKILLPLPPLSEQRRIVSILETWDKAIEELSMGIRAKKEVMNGLAQKLLSGSTRLPGYSAPWDSLKLGQICKISTGKKDVNQGNPSGRYPFFTCAKEHTFSDEYSFDEEAILIAGNGEAGHCQYYKGKFEAYQRTYVLSEFNGITVSYLYPYLKYYFQSFINSQIQMGAMPYIKLGMIKDFVVKAPNSAAEQLSVAEVFRIVNSEIELLEKKLFNFKSQKSYLLSTLMTGTIRIPGNLSI